MCMWGLGVGIQLKLFSFLGSITCIGFTSKTWKSLVRELIGLIPPETGCHPYVRPPELSGVLN